jgi:hypothetical protein
MSATHLRSAENQMNKAARNIFGKKGDCNVIFEALRGDLGWLSLKSKLDLAKLRFYGFIHRCGGIRLLRKVFPHRLKELANSEELTFSTRQLFFTETSSTMDS